MGASLYQKINPKTLILQTSNVIYLGLQRYGREMR